MRLMLHSGVFVDNAAYKAVQMYVKGRSSYYFSGAELALYFFQKGAPGRSTVVDQLFYDYFIRTCLIFDT